MRFSCLLLGLSTVAGVMVGGSSAFAATYQVGPDREHASLAEVVDGLGPGDVVEIDGGATYQEDVTIDVSGSDGVPITIRGVSVAGVRPVLSGAIFVHGDHIVLEGLEIRDGAPVCLQHGGHDLTVRDVVVHDCPNHGILGTDVGSGSLTLEYVEVYATATEQTGNRKHQIYVATDEVAHPGSVFRVQFSYVHDCGPGGSNIKSRAERTELYSNWIEGGGLYELELYGPDEDGTPDGWTEDLAREDADIAGNVFYRTENQDTDWLFRIGGDGSPDLGDAGLNDSKGRVRFTNNTVIAPSGTGVFRTFNRVDSVEVHNSVFFGEGGGLRMLDDEAEWVGGSQLVSGDHNWISEGTDVPARWAATVTGTDPALADTDGMDLLPSEASPLVDAASTPTLSPAGHEFPSPLDVPLYHPPNAVLLGVGEATPRPVVGTVDIGAYEFGIGPPQTTGASTGAGGNATASGSGAAGDAAALESSGCGCRMVSHAGHAHRAAALLACIYLAARRRRGRSERGA
jgi:hypothetical protein